MQPRTIIQQGSCTLFGPIRSQTKLRVQDFLPPRLRLLHIPAHLLLAMDIPHLTSFTSSLPNFLTWYDQLFSNIFIHAVGNRRTFTAELCCSRLYCYVFIGCAKAIAGSGREVGQGMFNPV